MLIEKNRELNKQRVGVESGGVKIADGGTLIADFVSTLFEMPSRDKKASAIIQLLGFIGLVIAASLFDYSGINKEWIVTGIVVVFLPFYFLIFVLYRTISRTYLANRSHYRSNGE
jgi:uncharacterized membrane protein YjjP (DUF1212 family)